MTNRTKKHVQTLSPEVHDQDVQTQGAQVQGHKIGSDLAPAQDSEGESEREGNYFRQDELYTKEGFMNLIRHLRKHKVAVIGR